MHWQLFVDHCELLFGCSSTDFIVVKHLPNAFHSSMQVVSLKRASARRNTISWQSALFAFARAVTNSMLTLALASLRHLEGVSSLPDLAHEIGMWSKKVQKLPIFILLIHKRQSLWNLRSRVWQVQPSSHLRACWRMLWLQLP